MGETERRVDRWVTKGSYLTRNDLAEFLAELDAAGAAGDTPVNVRTGWLSGAVRGLFATAVTRGDPVPLPDPATDWDALAAGDDSRPPYPGDTPDWYDPRPPARPNAGQRTVGTGAPPSKPPMTSLPPGPSVVCSCPQLPTPHPTSEHGTGHHPGRPHSVDGPSGCMTCFLLTHERRMGRPIPPEYNSPFPPAAMPGEVQATMVPDGVWLPPAPQDDS
jgi:hypothetical protein